MKKEKLKPWVDALLALVSTVIGIFAGKSLNAIVPPLFSPANLPHITFILVAILFFASAIFSITLWGFTQDSVAKIAKRTQRVQTVTYDEGYKELIRRIIAAENRILIFTEYINTFDWDNKKRIWDKERSSSRDRKSFYATLQKKLEEKKRERDKNNVDFHFKQFIQIPENHSIKEMLEYDPILKKNCEFIANLSPKDLNFASLRKVSGRLFSNSIIIIDDSFIHISFDINYPNLNEVIAPSVILIDDPSSEALLKIANVFDNINSFSVVLKNSDLGV